MTATKPPAPPSGAPVHISDEQAAGSFASARLDALRSIERRADGIYCCRGVTTGEALVALIGQADFESVALQAAHTTHQLQQMVVTHVDHDREEIKVTPRHTPEALRRALLGNERHARRLEAWVATPGVEFAKLTLASPTVRRMVMRRGRCSEQTVWQKAIDLVIDQDPAFIAHLLPYPTSPYQAEIAAAIAELPHRLHGYARDTAEATLSGERQWNHRWRPNRYRAITVDEAERVSRMLDRAVNRVRYQHLPVGTELWVLSYEDETIWPARVESVEYGATSPTIVRVAYPSGYQSPTRLEVINPASYPLERLIEPLSPLPALARDAAREGVPVPPRRFDRNEPNA